MRRILIALAVLVGGTDWSAAAECPVPGREHVVSAQDIADRLVAAEVQRAADIRSLEDLVASEPRVPESTAAAFRHALPSLTDDELHDLAARAASLSANPAAGDDELHALGRAYLIIGIVAVVLLIGIVVTVAAVA